MNNQIIAGSLGSIAKQSGKSLAESFMSCDIIIIIDDSGSMSSNDSRGGKSRKEIAMQELTGLQNSLPGKVAVIAFAGEVQFCPSGIPSASGSSTDMAKALKFVKIADEIPGMKFFLISDGQPDDEQATMKVAKTFKNKIFCIYVGPEDSPTGRDFLERLAKATGGQTVTADRAKELTSKIEMLLLK
jgi:Mg-chelatase subunit ChlD